MQIFYLHKNGLSVIIIYYCCMILFYFEVDFMKNWKIVLAILTVNVVLMAAGYTMLIPFLPMYLMNELGVSADDVKMWNGAIFSITFLIGGIMAPIWGKMADTHGKR